MSRRVRNIMPGFSIRFDEQQLVELAAKSRQHATKKGYLLKSDPKLKRLTPRWCSLYLNFFFYFESESAKPLGVIVLEGCTCKSVEQVDQVVNEGAIAISVGGGKTYYFVAENERDKLEWIQALNNSSMSKQQQELLESQKHCEEYSQIISTKNSEVSHLREANRQAQQNIEHLHGTLQINTTPRHLSLSANGMKSASPDSIDHKATVLQRFFRGWLLRRRWKKIVHEYLNSPLSQPGKQRNQLIWKFVASEEDYVSQLTILNEEYKQHLEMATGSRKSLLSLQQFNTLFRNSAELLLLHQLFLRGLHSCLEKWPVIVFSEILKLFVPIFSIYHKFVCDHACASEILFTLQSDPSFREFLSALENRATCNHLTLESLLEVPLKRLCTYVKDLEELCAHTPPSHHDYSQFTTTVTQLESIIKMMTDEGGQSEELRQVLKVEGMLEGGCRELLDKDQALIKQGILQHCEERATSNAIFATAKARTPPRHCFLFTKNLIIANRIVRKPSDVYKIVKILQLSKCHVSEYHQPDVPELTYCGVKIESTSSEDSEQTETTLLLAGSVNEKAEWIADVTQCIENEKQNKVLQSQSIGLPVELSSRFIRYSTLKTGKEQLVNSGKLDCLLERLVKISCFGHNFLNTFLLSFPFYTDADTVFNFLEKSLMEGIRSREKRRGSITPQDAIRDARVIQPQTVVTSPILSAKRRHYSSNLGSNFGTSLSVPRRRVAKSVQGLRKYADSFPNSTHREDKALSFSPQESFASIKISFEPSSSPRRSSGPCGSGSRKQDSVPSVAGALFALKQWICKHFYHFKNDVALSKKLEDLLETLKEEHMLTSEEKASVSELCHIYETQKDTVEELCPIMKLKLTKDIPHLPSKPFECLLLWSPRATAEQLCLIEGALFQRVSNGEILRYFQAKGASKSKLAPNLAMIFEHFNRMSLFFMWSVPNQRYFVDRTNILKFLIEVGWECYQLHNFSSVMQLTSALEHGSTSKFKQAWEEVPKNLKQQFRQLVQLSSTEGRFKELRTAMKKATPPSIPYLGILLSEISGVVEGAPTYLDEEKLINFSKMRRCVRLITMAMQHQKEPYEFQFIPEISKVLLHHTIPGNEDDLYQKVEEMEKNGELNPMPPS